MSDQTPDQATDRPEGPTSPAVGVEGARAANHVPSADGAQEPSITLDRYLSRRRPPVRSSWSQMISLIAMVAALVMLLVYKDQCGAMVSRMMNVSSPPSDASAPTIHYKP